MKMIKNSLKTAFYAGILKISGLIKVSFVVGSHMIWFSATLYWATNHYTIRLLLPIACMGLFVIHPIGAQAFVYSLYWLIPVILYFIPQRSLFLQALGSTFIAHAVGSVIWL